MRSYLDFEHSLAELYAKIDELKSLNRMEDISIEEQITNLESKAECTLIAIYSKLTPWQKTQVARHPNRPHFLDYSKVLFKDFLAFSGDRVFGEDQAIIGGFSRLKGQSVCIIGQEKGNNIETRLKHNFGMARPEGYRKAVRLFKLAEHYNLPVITFVDTAGAFPGIDAEERGQAEAIARSIETLLYLKVPTIAIVIGEGGSGGAIALGACDKVIMLEHSIYSVISPEGAASILWKDATKAKDAAESMKLTAQDLLELNVIDHVIGEPIGGAHRDHTKTIKDVGLTLSQILTSLSSLNNTERLESRLKRFSSFGSL